ncbi:MAG: ABC transporter permease, partial [Planctomycetota bacterium]
MILTIFETSLRRLLNRRGELLLVFVVPIVFFSIFALIFGRGVGIGKTPKIRTLFINQAGDAISQDVVASLKENDSLRMMEMPTITAEQDPVRVARDQVRRGMAALAIVLHRRAAPTDPDESMGGADAPTSSIARVPPLRADVYRDKSDAVAGQIVTALIAQSIAQHDSGRGFFEPMRMATRRSDTSKQTTAYRPSVGADEQSKASDAKDPVATVPAPKSSSISTTGIRQAAYEIQAGGVQVTNAGSSSPSNGVGSPANTNPDSGHSQNHGPVTLIDAVGDGKTNPVVTMYAAGIAVMFLLFGATNAGGALMEERENQTLERLLTTRLSMDELLLGKWCFQTALGVLQVGIMFVWGALVFGIDLFSNFDGFLVMTIVTSGAAASFGLLLATLCKSRGQL